MSVNYVWNLVLTIDKNTHIISYILLKIAILFA
jgi:hypothetical protein